jgi:type I restriction enzyme R subunit
MAPNQNPEQIARDNIDELLKASGWAVQDKNQIDLNAGLGQAVREYPTDTGPADYVLFVDKKAVGVIETKRPSKGENITTVEDQTDGYTNATLKWVSNSEPLPFLYESTGVITQPPAPGSSTPSSVHRLCWIGLNRATASEPV